MSATPPPPASTAPAERPPRRPYDLGPMPLRRAMFTLDERVVRAPVQRIFDLARRGEEWPTHLAHYRSVTFRQRARDGGGLVEMRASRPFGLFDWPTWWVSEMSVDTHAPAVRYRHVDGITTGMDVEWSFRPVEGGTHVRIVHAWDGPDWPVVGTVAALAVIGPIFVHGIASRTLAGLAAVAERV